MARRCFGSGSRGIMPWSWRIAVDQERRARRSLLRRWRADLAAFQRWRDGRGGTGRPERCVHLAGARAPLLWAVDAAHRYVLSGSPNRSYEPANRLRSRAWAISSSAAGSVAAAKRRLKHWFMVHCSLLYQMPIERIARYLALPDRQPAYRRRRSHQDFLSNLPLPRRILVEAIRATWSPGAAAFAAAGSCSGSYSGLGVRKIREPELDRAVLAFAR